MRVFLIIAICFTQSLTEEVLKVSAGDSYLDAYRESTVASAKIEKKADKKSDGTYPVYSGPPSQYGQPDPQYGPSSPASSPQYGPPDSQYGSSNPQYGPPNPQYGPPSPQYGPQAPQYGPQAPQYGPQAPQYGPPAPQYGPPPGPPPSYGTYGEPVPQYGPPIYGPPAQNLQVFYGMPHAMISIWDKLWEKIKWKINLFTLGKILLKLIIFKKIVSLIAIICLLLFIPSLKHKKLGFLHGDDGERSMQANILVPDNDSLNSLSEFAIGAIENHTDGYKKYPASCDTTYCRVKKSLKKLEKRISYKKLATLYASESSS